MFTLLVFKLAGAAKEIPTHFVYVRKELSKVKA